jgi:hypothetical protein
VSGVAHILGAAGPTLGSPLYRVLPDHLPGLLALGPGLLAVGLVRRRARAGGRLTSWLAGGYRALPADRRFLAWLLLATAAVHLGLVAGEPRPGLAVLFALDGLAFLEVVRRLLLGRRFRRWAALLLVGSILAYCIAVLADEPPDQVGVVTKLIEIAALALVMRPLRATLPRRLLASGATTFLVVATGLAVWAGAFAAASRAGGGHHGGAPEPGTLVHRSDGRPPTPAERAAVARFWRSARPVLARYRNARLAGADGYAVGGMVGNDFHAANAGHGSDGRIFDPVRPEALVYARTSRGALLLGAVYEMPSLEASGPRIGGPLTEWHSHEQVCFSLMPPALSGLVSPFGGCPVGSIAVPGTPEMIHLWVVPGAPRFGDLDDGLRRRYISSFEATGRV